MLGLIENSAQEHIHGDVSKLNPEQRMLEVGLSSTFTSVLQQCSSAIFKVLMAWLMLLNLEYVMQVVIYPFMIFMLYKGDVGGIRKSGNKESKISKRDCNLYA